MFTAGGLTVFGEQLNKMVFGQKQIVSERDKIWLVQTLGLWLALYLFGLSCSVMTLRILTGKATPASNNDPLVISTLNRILTNTIEQSVIFAGFFGVILFSDANHVGRIGGVRVLAIASIFVVARVCFLIGYILGSVTKISSFRSFGFATGVFLNVGMVLYHLGFNVYDLLDHHAAPVLKGFLV